MPSTYQVVPKTPLWLAVAIMAFRWSVVSKYQGTQVTQDGARTDTKAREVADKTSHRASILTATWVRARLLGKAELHARRMEAAAQPFLVQPRSDDFLVYVKSIPNVICDIGNSRAPAHQR